MKEQLLKQIEELKRQVELLDKPKFEVGKWYKYDGHLFNYQEGFNVYGFEHGSWCESSNGSWKWDTYFKDLIPATDKEVEEALIKEAKKRGFKEGVLVKIPNREPFVKNQTILKSIIKGDFFYNVDHDGEQKLMNNGGCIFSSGKWAEIVKDEPIKIGGYEVVKEQYGFKIGCKKFRTEFIKELQQAMESQSLTKVAFDGIETDLETINKILNL